MGLDTTVARVEGFFSSAGKIVISIIALVSFITSCAYAITEYAPLPKQVERVEDRLDQQEELLRFLVCSSIAQSRNAKVEGCIFIIRDTDYYDDFQRGVPSHE